jgi:hypothetical protein
MTDAFRRIIGRVQVQNDDGSILEIFVCKVSSWDRGKSWNEISNKRKVTLLAFVGTVKANLVSYCAQAEASDQIFKLDGLSF